MNIIVVGRWSVNIIMVGSWMKQKSPRLLAGNKSVPCTPVPALIPNSFVLCNEPHVTVTVTLGCAVIISNCNFVLIKQD